MLRSSDSLFYVLERGDVLSFVPPVIDAPRSSKISSIEFFDDSAKVEFEDIDCADTASLLVGCTCLVKEDDIAGRSITGIASSVASGIDIGWHIVDSMTGSVLEITDIRDYPSQQMAFAIDHSECEHPRADLMVPLAEQLIDGIDEEAKVVRMSLPNGLIEPLRSE